MAEKVLVGVKFDAETIAAIDVAAGRRSINRSEFVRRCVERVLAAEPGAPPIPTKSRPAPVKPPKAGVPTMDLLDGKRQVEPMFKKQPPTNKEK